MRETSDDEVSNAMPHGPQTPANWGTHVPSHACTGVGTCADAPPSGRVDPLQLALFERHRVEVPIGT